MRHVSYFVALALSAPVSHAHRVPDVFITGQSLLDQFDPAVKPKILHSADGTFVAELPAKGWATDAERIRHVKSIDAENGRWYIHAVFDAERGRSFCFGKNDRPDDETFYEDVIRDLRALPRDELRRRSAAELIAGIWRKKWPCTSAPRRDK
jgi:hypothetical protein